MPDSFNNVGTLWFFNVAWPLSGTNVYAIKKSIIFLMLLLSACAQLSEPKEKPLLHEAELRGDYTALAHCVVNQLRADPRQFMRMLHYRLRIYPDIVTTDIYAYDTRFMPGIYPSNSPNNPDAVLDYMDTDPEILPGLREPVSTDLKHKFVLITKKKHENAATVTIKGDKFLGDIAWGFLQSCE